MCAAAARAPAADAPTLSTATPTPRSAQEASASASRSPSPSDSQNSATEPRPSPGGERLEPIGWRRGRSGCRSRPGCGSRSRAATPIAFTATLPLCEIIATRPGRSAGTESPQSGARAPTATIPLPFGPQTGSPVASAISRSSRSSSRPCGDLGEPGGEDDRAAAAARGRLGDHRRHPGRRDRDHDRVHRLWQLGDRGHARADRERDSRFGLTPQTVPAKPARARLRSTVSA